MKKNVEPGSSGFSTVKRTTSALKNEKDGKGPQGEGDEETKRNGDVRQQPPSLVATVRSNVPTGITHGDGPSQAIKLCQHLETIQ